MHDAACSDQAAARHRPRYGKAATEFLSFCLYVSIVAGALRLFQPALLRYDDGYFFLISYSWLNGLGFNNFWVNPISSGVFNWHGFLQPMLLSLLAPCRTLSCINIGLVATGGVFLALWYVLANAVIAAWPMRAALYVIGVGCVLQYSARPELLAATELLLIAAIFLSLRQRPDLRGLLAGAVIGLTAATDPAAALLTGLGVGLAVIYWRRDGQGLAGVVYEGFLCVVAALVVLLALLLALYPHGAMTWIEGIRAHSAVTADRIDHSGFIKAYFTIKFIPLQIVMLIALGIALGFAFLSVWRANRMLGVLFSLLAGAFVFALYFTAIRIPAASYNFSVLIPVLALICAGFAVKYPRRGVAEIVLSAPIFVFAAACMLGQMLWIVQKVMLLRDYDRLSAEIAHSVDGFLTENRSIAMDPPLMLAVDNPTKLARVQALFFGRAHKMNDDPPKTDILFRAQSEFGDLPKEIPGFRLVLDRFDHSWLARFVKPEGPYFAIYETVRP